MFIYLNRAYCGTVPVCGHSRNYYSDVDIYQIATFGFSTIFEIGTAEDVELQKKGQHYFYGWAGIYWRIAKIYN